MPLTFEQMKYIIETWGLPILVVIFLLFLLWFVIKMHKTERAETAKVHLDERMELRKTNLEMTDRVFEAIDKMDKSLNANTNAIEGLKLILNSVNEEMKFTRRERQ